MSAALCSVRGFCPCSSLLPLRHLHLQGLAGGRLRALTHDGAPSGDDVAHAPHDDRSRARVQACTSMAVNTRRHIGFQVLCWKALLRLALSVPAHHITWRSLQASCRHIAFMPHASTSTEAGVCAPLVGSSINTMLGLATCAVSASTVSAPATPSVFELQEQTSDVSNFRSIVSTLVVSFNPRHASRSSRVSLTACQVCKASQPRTATSASLQVCC